MFYARPSVRPLAGLSRPTARRGGALALLLAVALAVAAAPSTARAAGGPEQVDAAVKRAVVWLYAQQKPTGQWEGDLKRNSDGHDWASRQGGTFGGYTALCTFALLEAGERPGDARIERAVKFLREADMFGVYAIGLRAMVFAKLPPTPENRAVLQRDADRLVAGMIKTGPARGLWDYDSNRPGGRGGAEGVIDLSISQFGVLGLWSAVQAGVRVPPEVWKTFDEVWRKQQSADGAWSYDGEPGHRRATISAAGVATLLIVQDVLGAPMQAAGSDPHIGRGIARVGRSFDEVGALGAYAWYGVERIGTAGGIGTIGPHDWYDAGCRSLLARQKEDGSWPDGTAPGMEPLPETAMAVLFLVHGRAATVLAKLDYGGLSDRSPDWNRRPRDAANLVKFMSAALEQPLNWRTVGARSAPSEMLQSPVMLASGAKDVILLPAERERLKGYLDAGGLLVANAEAAARDGQPGADEFSRSIVRLGADLYPNYKFRELPPTHPIYTDQQFRPTGWKDRPVLWGLGNGVRELIVLIPQGDLARGWHSGSVLAPADRAKFEVGADVVQYAVARQPNRGGLGTGVRSRYAWDHTLYPPQTRPATLPATTAPAATAPAPGDPPAANPADPNAPPPPEPPPGAPPPDAKFLVVGRLTVGENWDPEPYAWKRVSTLLANGANLFVTTVPVAATPADLAKVRMVHWTGTTAVRLAPEQRQALAAFAARGGTIVVDAAGGSAAFADSAAGELALAFAEPGKSAAATAPAGPPIVRLNVNRPPATAPATAATTAPATTNPTTFGALLSADDPVFNQPGAGNRVAAFAYRPYARSKLVGKLDVPRLRGLAVGSRTAVFFSREDLTAGCVGQNTDGIIGYSPLTATTIMRNLTLWAARDPAKVARPPTRPTAPVTRPATRPAAAR